MAAGNSMRTRLRRSGSSNSPIRIQSIISIGAVMPLRSRHWLSARWPSIAIVDQHETAGRSIAIQIIENLHRGFVSLRLGLRLGP